MLKPVDLVQVTFNNKAVGRIALNRKNLAVFEYSNEWLETGFSVSPFYLPLKSNTFVAKQEPFEGLFGVFNDSLPDGWGRLIIDRFLRQKGTNPNSLSVLDRLSLVGKNGMGALSYEPENEIYSEKDNDNLDFFAKEVEKIIKAQEVDSLELLIAKNGSSAGVRPKVIIKHEEAFWLVKFPAQYDAPDIGVTEYKCAQLAKKCGIVIPEAKLFKEKFFGSKLFDREKGKRFHVHSASGLLYANHRLPALDYEDLLKLTRAITNDVEEVEKMFRLMIFNVLIKNKDDHAKNFSFIHTGEKWILSPAYDLTPSYGFNGNHSTTIMGQGNPEKSQILKLAEKIGFPVNKAKTMYEEMSEYCMSSL